jgi:uncharacterized protein (DUF1697 family)
MIVAVSLLRGVNVGGHNKIKMEELKELYQSLGLLDAQTHVQSGNIAFRTKKCDLGRLSRRIEEAIEHNFGFRPSLIHRTTSDLRQVIAANPFAKRSGINPAKLLVFFLAEVPAAQACKNALAIPSGPEDLRLMGRELFIYFPDGQGRSKLPMPRIEKALETPCTGRNWNTVTKLLAIAEAMEAF